VGRGATLHYQEEFPVWEKCETFQVVTLLTMARCKNVEFAEPQERPAQATVTIKKKTKKKKTACVECGLRVRSSNMARHRRTQHPVPRGATPRSSPEPVVSPLRLQLSLQLPAVVKALDRTTWRDAEKDVPDRQLPPTPTSEEEFVWAMAKLYSGRVSQQSASTISYKLTKDIAAVAGNPEQRTELKEVLLTAGMVLLTEEQWEVELQEAEARGEDRWRRTKPLMSEAQTQVEDTGMFSDLFQGSVVFTPMFMSSASSLGRPGSFKMVPC